MERDGKESNQKWKWILLFGNIICFFVYAGHLRSFGIFVVPIQNTFGVNVATIGSVLTVRSISITISCLTAPALSDRFSERKVVIIASVFHLLGYLVVFVANHIVSLYIWAIIFGLCYGYITIPTQIIIGKYFGKRRAMAMGILTSGGSLGQLILPPLCAVLMNEYLLSGCFLITGGIFLNCAAAGALQRPLSSHSGQGQTANTATDMCNTTTVGTNATTLDKTRGIEPQTEVEFSLITESFNDDKENGEERHEKSYEWKNSTTLPIEEQEIELSNSDANIPRLADVKSNVAPAIFQDVDPISERLVDKNNTTKSGSTKGTYVIVGDTENRKAQSIYTQITVFLQRQFDLSLLKIPKFSAFVLLNGVCFALFLGSKTFLVAIAEDKALDGELSLLLTLNACTDIAGRVMITMLVNSKILRVRHIVLLGNLFAAIFIGIYPLTDQYWSMMTVAGIMGLSSASGAYMALPVVVELVGVSRMSKGLGWYSFAMFLTPMIVVPILGLIRDVTGSYDVVFYLSGGCTIAIVFTYFIVEFIIEHTAKRSKRTPTSTEEEVNDETENIPLATGDEVVYKGTRDD